MKRKRKRKKRLLALLPYPPLLPSYYRPRKPSYPVRTFASSGPFPQRRKITSTPSSCNSDVTIQLRNGSIPEIVSKVTFGPIRFTDSCLASSKDFLIIVRGSLGFDCFDRKEELARGYRILFSSEVMRNRSKRGTKVGERLSM